MSPDYFSILGLEPGVHPPATVAAHFLRRRAALHAASDCADRRDYALRGLDELYVAFRALRNEERQREYLAARARGETPAAAFERLVACSLDGGFLRHSRRMALLAEARRLGIPDFHAHLLIAQAQFGPPATHEWFKPAARVAETVRPIVARFAAAGVLALVMLLATVRWLQL